MAPSPKNSSNKLLSGCIILLLTLALLPTSFISVSAQSSKKLDRIAALLKPEGHDMLSCISVFELISNDKALNRKRKVADSNVNAYELVDKYNQLNHKHYRYLKHDPKDGNIGKIIVWDGSTSCNILSIAKAVVSASFVRKHLLKWDIELASSIIKEIINRASTEEVKLIARDLDELPELQVYAYKVYFEEFASFDEIIDALENNLKSVGRNTILAASEVAAKRLIDERTFIDYFEKFRKPFHYDLAFSSANKFITCERILFLFRNTAILKGVDPKFIRDIEISCLATAPEFADFFLDNLDADSSELDFAARSIARKLTFDNCKIFDLLEFSQICKEFPSVLLPRMIACIEDDIKDCIAINRVFDDSTSIREVLTRMVGRFKPDEITPIIKQPPYLGKSKQVEEAYLNIIQNVKGLEDFLELFPLSNSNRLRAYRLGIELADKEANRKKLIEYIGRFLGVNGKAEEIQYYLTTETMLDVVETTPSLRHDLHDPILSSIGNNKELIDKYLQVYRSNAEQLLSEIGPSISASVAIYLFNKISSDQGQIIERYFPSKISKEEHVKWYLKHFAQSEYANDVLLKGVMLTNNTSNKYEYLNSYLLKVGYNPTLVGIHLQTVEEKLEFLDTYTYHKEAFCEDFLKTTLNLAILDRLCSTCNVNPEDLDIERLLYNDIKAALAVPKQSRWTSDSQKSTAPIVLPIQNLGQIGIAVKGLRNRTKALLVVQVGNAFSQSFKLTKSEPVIFISAASFYGFGSEMSIRITYTDNPKAVELIAINFPAQVSLRHLQSHFEDGRVRQKLIRSIDQLLDNNNDLAFQEQLLDSQYLYAIRKFPQKSLVNELMIELALNYTQIYHTFPPSFLQVFKRGIAYYQAKLNNLLGRR